ncbi:MAG: hypothetical protein ACTSPA_00880 [Promethearchaeota archaeon]
MSREKDKKKRVQSIRKEFLPLTESDIKRKVNKVGKKVFVISSIVPAIFTIFYLIFIFPDEISDPYFDYFYSYNLYGILISWLVVIFVFTMPAMIGKNILFTENKNRIFIVMPIITLVICVIFSVMIFFIFQFSGGEFGGLLVIILIMTVISAIIAQRLYDKHIFESKNDEKGAKDKAIQKQDFD